MKQKYNHELVRIVMRIRAQVTKDPRQDNSAPKDVTGEKLSTENDSDLEKLAAAEVPVKTLLQISCIKVSLTGQDLRLELLMFVGSSALLLSLIMAAFIFRRVCHNRRRRFPL